MVDTLVTGISTVCVPPLREPQLDQPMLARLGLA
jgi:hypothetical protein